MLSFPVFVCTVSVCGFCVWERVGQSPDVPWTSYAVPPGPGLVPGFFTLKQNPFFHRMVLLLVRDIGNWLNAKFLLILLKK